MMGVDWDRTRAGYIEGLRMLADLLERQPDIPHYEHGAITFALGGTEAEGFEVIERAAAALTAAGVEFERNVSAQGRSIEFVLGGLRYSFSRLTDAARAEFQAQRSYQDNVQVT